MLEHPETWFVERYIHQSPNSNIDYEKVWHFISGLNEGKTDLNLEDANERTALTHVIYHNDLKNLLEKKLTYYCDLCQKMGYTLGHCEYCIRDLLMANFSAWSSGDHEVDQCIQEAQMKCPVPRQIYEFVPWKDFTSFQQDKNQLLATWTRGYVSSFDRAKNNFVRNQNWQVDLKQVTEDYIKGCYFKDYLNLRIRGCQLRGFRGITKDDNGVYYLILDKMKQTLSDFVESSKFNPNNIYQICRQIAKVLKEIYPNVHGNLNRDNILQRFDQQWVLSELEFPVKSTTPEEDIHDFGCLVYDLLSTTHR